jgi:hypothetical protein
MSFHVCIDPAFGRIPVPAFYTPTPLPIAQRTGAGPVAAAAVDGEAAPADVPLSEDKWIALPRQVRIARCLARAKRHRDSASP